MCVGEIASYIHIYLSVAEDRLLLFAGSLCKSQLVRLLINRNQALVRATFFHLEAKEFLTTLSAYRLLLQLLLFCLWLKLCWILGNCCQVRKGIVF